MHGQIGASLLNFGQFFHNHNLAAFCIDLRAHGLSGGNQIGFGYTETRDIKALLDWIKKQTEYEDEEIILYGISMGGATAINSAAKYDEISQVISVSSFASYENTFLDYMRSDGAPELMVQVFKPSIRLILALKYDIKPQKEAPVSNIKDIDIPIYLIHGDQDQQI